MNSEKNEGANSTVLTIGQALEQAVQHHRAGRWQEAEHLYRAILQAQPKHPDANHNLAVLAVKVGQLEAGLPYFKAAIEAQPAQGEYWISYIDALIRAGQTDSARQALEQGRQMGLNGEAAEALGHRLEPFTGTEQLHVGKTLPPVSRPKPQSDKTRPKLSKPQKLARRVAQHKGAGSGPSPQEINSLIALFNQRRYSEVVPLARAITGKFPWQGLGWKVLGAAFQNMKRSPDALMPMEKAAMLLPNDAEAHYNLGTTFKDLGRLEMAEAAYRQALKVKPNYPDAHYGLGNILMDMRRLEEAAACYGRALEINPDNAEVHNNLGNTLKGLRRLADAEASYRRALAIKLDYTEAYNNLGTSLQDMGRLDDAEACYRRALEIKSDYVEAHNNLGNILRDLTHYTEAETSLHRALAIRPEYAEAHSNLGSTLQDSGRLEESETSYRRALEIRPDYAEVHSNLGSSLQELGRLAEAEASYRRAIEIKPDFAVAHYNLGNILKNLGQPDEAEASYREAHRIKPDYVNALNNLASLFNDQGKPSMALDIVRQSLQIERTEEAKGLFAACVQNLRFTHEDSEIRGDMVRALTEPWGRPNNLARVGVDLVKLNPAIDECVTRATDAWPLRLSAQDLFGQYGPDKFVADTLLRTLLDTVPICDIEMERFLAMTRHALLETAAGIRTPHDDDDTSLSFYSVLARQCFINEYVFSYTDGEIRKAIKLRDLLVAGVEAQAPLPALWLVAVAAYFPLYSLPCAARLLERSWPVEVTAVLVQQVCEPAEELQLRTTIPRLTRIEDEVSLLVQNQYEENPYPRWVKAPVGKSMNIAAYFRQRFPLACFKCYGMTGNIDVLIAGCGTGQHPIGTAQRIRGAQVLAVDLSMSSLSYAKRKTKELGLTSIEYAQADLLKLGLLGRSFDVIESCGVLHHLADPFAGWQVLLSVLRPGGFMKLAFYSEVARRNIVRIRNFIAEQGVGTSADEIRLCRQALVDLDKKENFGNTLRSLDFFSTSTCRDLLFHVQEHRMSLTGIEAFLQDNNLAFLGFEIEGQFINAYKQRFPGDCAAINLSQWQVFENENPLTFSNMYQFWIQKGG